MLQLNPIRSVCRLAAVAAVMALCACVPTSEEKLEGRGDSGSALLGAWFGELDGSQGYLHVVDDRSSSLTAIFVGDGRSGDKMWVEADAFPAVIDGVGYISAIQREHNGTKVPNPNFVILRYRAGRGYISLYAMDAEIVEEAIKKQKLEGTVGSKGPHITASGTQIARFIEENGGAELFSDQIGYLERVDEEDLPSVSVRTQR